MFLPKAQSDFDALVVLLNNTHGLGLDVGHILVLHDPKEDERNRREPRGFCSVDPNNTGAIRCAAAIEELRPEARIGILYHELGHIMLDAFESDESEVDVDEWCAHFAPEAGYTYMDTTYWRDLHKPVVAKSLQHVSRAFAQQVEDTK